MKKNILVLMALVANAAAQQTDNIPGGESATFKSRNLPLIDMYLTAPRGLNGLGFGIGIFSPSIRMALASGTELRIGGDFHFTGLDRRVIRDVPLQSPQTGTAKVRLNETLFGFNAVARLSRTWNEKITPYADGFVGLRGLSAGISVTPDEYQPGYESATSDNLDNAFALQYGGSAGMLIGLGRNVKLNAAVMFSRSFQETKLDDIHSASLEGTRLMLKKKTLPGDFILFKLGITFRFDASEKSTSCCQCCGRSLSASAGNRTSAGLPASGGSPNRIGVGRVLK